MSKQKKRGLVLPGGASLGSYQAGVLKAFHEYDIEFEVISATSIGTLHAFAWNIEGLVPELGDHWEEQVRDLKPFDLSRILSGTNPIQFAETLNRITERYEERFPFGEERTDILITLAHHPSLRKEVISVKDPSLTREDVQNALKASTAIIHVGSKPLAIKGERYFDGGYLDNVPIRPLVHRYPEIDEVWVVLFSDFQTYQRTDTLRRFFSLPKSNNLYLRSLQKFLTQDLRPIYQDDYDFPHTNADMHFITPSERIRRYQSFLFDMKQIKRLYDMGYRDGLNKVKGYLAA